VLAALLKQQGSSAEYAAYWLGKIGPDAKEALPELKETLKDGRADVKKAAREALQKIDPDHEPKSLKN
jgi:HEAT repeat protein